jgi:ATP-binding cassette subfamily B protein
MAHLLSLAWPVARLGEAIAALAQRQGWGLRGGEVPVGPEASHSNDATGLDVWLEAMASWLGLEAALVQTPYADVEAPVRRAGPALIRLPGLEKTGFLALLGCRGRRVRLLGPDLLVHGVTVQAVCQALRYAVEVPLLEETDQVLEAMAMGRRRRARARRAMLGERLGAARLGHCWLLRLPAEASFWQHVRQERLLYCLLQLLIAYTAQYICWMSAWWLLGRGALQGRFDPGWLTAWGLLLLTIMPLRLGSMWAQGRLAIGLGSFLKTRLLAGALRLAPEEVRHQGAGQFLGRVLEAEAVEALALSGGMLGLLAVIELALAAVVLGSGSAGWLHVGLMLVWLGITLVLSWRYLCHRKAWTETRLTMTHALVERMVGHRTRLAQEPPKTWHIGEDQDLSAYLASSHRLDYTEACIAALIPRGWLLVGLLGLAPAWVTGHDTATTVAIGVGGILLAYGAYSKLAAGMAYLAGAVIAWQQVSSLFGAATRQQVTTPPAYVVSPGLRSDNACDLPTLEAHGLVFRHRTNGAPVIKGCSLEIRAGDRLLLEGPSGGGKSTLASLLTGLRQPEAGLLFSGGLDMHTLGATGWRQAVVSAPQFHDNYVFSGSLAFNLLMGRHWPPDDQDLAAAEAVCRALDLGPLLDRMPAGLLQVVGETGWQLSHGERSRLYIARALLQNAAVLILDESFAALDPKTLHRVQQCVLAHAPSLIVIAHP